MNTASPPPAPLEPPAVPDQGSVILHFDVASFYCSVEEQRQPDLAGRPFAVTQKWVHMSCLSSDLGQASQAGV